MLDVHFTCAQADQVLCSAVARSDGDGTAPRHSTICSKFAAIWLHHISSARGGMLFARADHHDAAYVHDLGAASGNTPAMDRPRNHRTMARGRDLWRFAGGHLRLTSACSAVYVTPLCTWARRRFRRHTMSARERGLRQCPATAIAAIHAQAVAGGSPPRHVYECYADRHAGSTAKAYDAQAASTAACVQVSTCVRS